MKQELIDSLRKYAPEAEASGRLHPAQLDVIDEQRWFHLFVPVEYGGLGLSLPEAVRLEEEIAYADGSTGWVVTLCAGAAMFIGFFDKQLADEVFDDPKVCIAGSGHVNGTATPNEDGYLINGVWPYASGAPHAGWLTANCLVGEKVQSFIFKREEVELQPTWKYIGLNATAGYSYAAVNLQVPAHRTFTIDPANAVLPHPVYRYPFLQLAETTISANIAGMSMCFLHMARELILRREPKYERAEAVRKKGLSLADEALQEMKALKKKFYTALDDSWHEHTRYGATQEPTLNKVSKVSLALAQRSRELVNGLYPYCGMEAARTESAINQVWRNINTASQHTLLVEV